MGWRMSCDVGEVTERLENEQSYIQWSRAHSPTFPSLYLRHNSFSSPSVPLPTSQLILKPFRCATYVAAHSPTLPLLYPRHSSFSNPSVASPTSQLILQPFRCFTYITAHSPTLLSLFLHHSSFSNPSFASPTSQALHLRHLASRPWFEPANLKVIGITLGNNATRLHTMQLFLSSGIVVTKQTTIRKHGLQGSLSFLGL